MSNRRTDVRKGLILDDFGNPVKLPDGAVEQTSDGGIRTIKPLDGRVVERNAGCWNCLYFDTGTLYDIKVGASYNRDVSVFLSRGLSPDVARKRADETRRTLRSKKGIFGTCTVGGAEGDFVHQGFLCTKWSGRVGASLTRAPGEPLSPLMAEEYDKRGETARLIGAGAVAGAATATDPDPDDGTPRE